MFLASSTKAAIHLGPEFLKNSEIYKNTRFENILNAEKVKNYAKKFSPRHWTFLGPGSEKRWCGDSHCGQWDRTANKMVQQFKEIGQPVFIITSAFESRNLQAEKRQKYYPLQWRFCEHGTLCLKHLIP